MMNWANWRLKNKIAAAISGMFCFSLIVIGALVYFKMTKDYELRTRNLMDATIRQMNITLDVHMQNIERLSVSMLSDPIIQRVLRKPSDIGPQEDNNEMNYRMLLLSSPWPFIQRVDIFSEDGRVFNLSRGDSLGSDVVVQEEPWYDIMSGTSAPVLLYVPTGQDSPSSANAKTVFSLVRPINDIETGKRLAFLKIDLQTELFQTVVGSASRIDQNMTPRYLVLQDTHVMFDSYHRLTGQQLEADALQSFHGTSGVAAWSGERYLFSAAESTGTHWKTVSVLPYAESVKESIRIRNLLIWLGIAFLIMMALCSYSLAAKMVRPLSKVMATMKRVEMGDFKVRLLESGNRDEIGQLSRIFNIMLESVDHLIHRVYQAELREKDSQLQALQAQINPHMLFNTLNLMKALCRKRDVPEAALMAEALADLFRYSLHNWRRTVTLQEELEHVRNYMRIQELRFPNKLAYRCDVPESMRQAQIVRLSIQPLVENAIIYGVEQSLDLCSVEITARYGAVWSETAEQQLTTVVVTVADTGPGIPQDRLERLERQLADDGNNDSDNPASGGDKIGIGLTNVHKRLQLLFGEAFGLRIRSEQGIGTKVELTVPDSASIIDEEDTAQS